MRSLSADIVRLYGTSAREVYILETHREKYERIQPVCGTYGNIISNSFMLSALLQQSTRTSPISLVSALGERYAALWRRHLDRIHSSRLKSIVHLQILVVLIESEIRAIETVLNLVISDRSFDVGAISVFDVLPGLS